MFYPPTNSVLKPYFLLTILFLLPLLTLAQGSSIKKRTVTEYVDNSFFFGTSVYTQHSDELDFHFLLIRQDANGYNIEPVPAESWCLLDPNDTQKSINDLLECDAAIPPSICYEPGNTCYGNLEMAQLELRFTNILGNQNSVKSNQDISYETGEPFVSETTYEYETEYYLPRNIIVLDSEEGARKVSYLYPFDFDTPLYDAMVEDNYLSKIVELSTTEEADGTSIPISLEKFNYKETSGSYQPESKEIAYGTHPIELRETYEYNNFNDIVQTQTIEGGGMNMVYVWGYDGQSIVAQVQNATYDAVEAQLGGAAAVEDIRNNSYDDTALLGLLQSLYNLPNSLVTLYTHKPGFGVTSITDPNETQTFYEYDSHGRLRFIRDHQDNIVKEYQYKIRCGNDSDLKATIRTVSGIYKRGEPIDFYLTNLFRGCGSSSVEWVINGQSIPEVTEISDYVFEEAGPQIVKFRITNVDYTPLEVTKSFQVQDIPFSGSISAESTSFNQGDQIQFRAVGLSGYRKELNSYTWNIDGQSFTGQTVNYTFETAGPKTISLTISNPGYEDDYPVSTIVTINEIPFSATPIATQYEFDRGTQVTFAATNIQGYNTHLNSYTWNMDGETNLTGQNVDYTFRTPGEKLVQLRVSNPNYPTDFVSTLTVTSREVPFGAEVAIQDNCNLTDRSLHFSLQNHEAGFEGHLTNYEWKLDGVVVKNGTSASDEYLDHTFSDGGDKLITLTMSNPNYSTDFVDNFTAEIYWTTVSNRTPTFNSGVETKRITIAQTPYSFTHFSDTWFWVPAQGIDFFDIEVSANTTGSDRPGTMEITFAGCEKVTIDLTQYANSAPPTDDTPDCSWMGVGCYHNGSKCVCP